MRIFILMAMDGEHPYRVVRAYHNQKQAFEDLDKAEAFATELGQAQRLDEPVTNPGTDPGCCIENGFVTLYNVDGVELVD